MASAMKRRGGCHAKNWTVFAMHGKFEFALVGFDLVVGNP